MSLWEVCLYWYCQHASIHDAESVVNNFSKFCNRVFPQKQSAKARKGSFGGRQQSTVIKHETL